MNDASKAQAHPHDFSVGDRVRVNNSELTTNGETGVVTAVKPTGLIVIRFDSADPRGGRSHNQYRPSNLQHIQSSATVADAPRTRCVEAAQFYREIEFVCAIYDDDTFIYMASAKEEKEIIEKAVKFFNEFNVQNPGVKVIKAPAYHRWNGDFYKNQIVKVKPHAVQKFEYFLTIPKEKEEPEMIDITIDQTDLKIPNDDCNAFGHALRACYMYPDRLHVGSSIYVKGSVFKIGYGFEHAPSSGVFMIDNRLHLYCHKK